VARITGRLGAGAYQSAQQACKWLTKHPSGRLQKQTFDAASAVLNVGIDWLQVEISWRKPPDFLSLLKEN
jgi:hypothetical protein